MEEIILAYSSPAQLWKLLDKEYDLVFVHKFCPTAMMEWWKTNLKTREGMVFNDLIVRNMQMDIKTDLQGLKKIISLRNSYPLRIYQFEKLIPETFVPDNSAGDTSVQILPQDGLKHYFYIERGLITVASADPGYIIKIKEDPDLQHRIR